MLNSLIHRSNLFFSNTYKRIDWKCVGAVFLAFVVTRLMVVVVTYFSMVQIPVRLGEDLWRYNPHNIIPDGLIRWDSGWYIDILKNGYTLHTAAFFPFYPLIIKLSTIFTSKTYLVGLLISNISFLVSLFYLYAFTQEEFDASTAGRVVFYLACAPAAFVFSTYYSESIFMLFITACFYYSRHEKWFLAGLAGALASATRLTGVLIAVFILFEALWQKGVRFIPKPWSYTAQIDLIKSDLRLLPKAWKGIAASVFSTSGLIAFMVFLYQKFGDPLAFLHAEANWDKTISWDWPAKLVENLYNMHKLVGNIYAGGIGGMDYLMDSLSMLVFLPLVVIVFFKFRPSFGWFTLLSFIMPLISSSPISMRRYVLALIPCYILLALWGKRTWVDRIILGVSLPLQAYLLVLFSHWIFAG